MRHWLDTCPACMVTHGDNHLYDEGDGSGPPPFARTWKDTLPTVPGGPLPARPLDDPPGRGIRRSSGLTLNAALDILTGGGGVVVGGAEPDRPTLASGALRSQIPSMRARLERDGVLIRRVLVFDRFGPARAIARDALVIADVYEAGAKVGAFLGQVSTLSVLKEVATQGDTLPYGTLREAAEAHLWELRAQGPVDRPADWFKLLCLLEDPAFVEGWIREGSAHRFPTEGLPARPSTWQPAWMADEVDTVDLLWFYFVRYLAGLPIRYRWSVKIQGWFQPDDRA